MDKKEKAEATEEADKEVTTPTEESTEESEEEGTDDSSKTTDLDLDDELEKETKRGKPDPAIAREAFKKREKNRSQSENDDDDGSDDEDERPLTRRDLAEIRTQATQAALRQLQEEQAQTIANTMAASPKEAALIFAKWKNRQFPEGLPLGEQIEEAYAITHRKKLIGEKNEALTALRNKDFVRKDSSTTQRKSAAVSEPKLSASDRAAYASAGYVWDATQRLYKKPLSNGRMILFKDPVSGKTWTAAQ